MLNQRPNTVVLCLLLSLPLAAVAHPDQPSGGIHKLNGTVQSGVSPIPFASVALYLAGSQQRGAGATLVGKAHSDANGHFQISYRSHVADGEVLYLIAEFRAAGSGRGILKLAAVLNPVTPADTVTINERTTVAVAYALAQFTDGQQIGGKLPGLRNAAATAQNLADLTTGDVGVVLGNPPNGDTTSTMRTFNSLANLLAACVQSPTNCSALFAAATSPRGLVPRDTLQALVNIARNPWQNVGDLFTLSERSTVYSPALLATNQPDAWTLAVRYIGDGPNGEQIDGPGNIAFDKDGNAWVSLNYQFDLEPTNIVCGADYIAKLTPTGGSAPGAPYFFGGLYGAGFGITLDPGGNVWTGNFGFQGADCPVDFQPLAMSVSEFSANGTALSPTNGFSSELINQPQGTVSDRQGNIWIANCSGSSITVIPGGDVSQMRNIDGIGSKPFDIAIDTGGNAWVTVNNERTGPEVFPTGIVREVAPDGSFVGRPVTGNDGIHRPMGIATDSQGNVWVANSGVIDLPCEGAMAADMITGDIGTNGEMNAEASVSLIRPLSKSKRVVQTFGKENGPLGGLVLPWGVAIDGDDNVFVANFAGQRLTELCGVRLKNCPPGKHVGDPISPDSGYTSDALVRNTGVQIDSSGNVWLANNWIEDALENQTNPGGHEVVVFIGLAAPIRTPLIGPPEQP